MQRYTKGDEIAFKQRLDEVLRSAQTVVVTSHKRPDDDSISSVLSLYLYLSRTYPQISLHISYAGEALTRWSYFEGFDLVRFNKDPGEKREADVIIMVDASGFDTISDYPDRFSTFEGTIIAIDHHKNAPIETMLGYIDSEASSCAELIYRLFYKDRALSPRISELILLGILGDTGSFTYIRPNQTEVFSIAERLVREGNINIQGLKAQYMKYSPKVFALLQQLMSHFTIVEDSVWGTYSIGYLERADVLRITSTESDVSAARHIFVDSYSKSIEGVSWGIVITPSLSHDEYTASFRSLPQGVIVRHIAEGLKVGGGHDLASGGKFKGATSAEECINMVKNYLKDNTPQKPSI